MLLWWGLFIGGPASTAEGGPASTAERGPASTAERGPASAAERGPEISLQARDQDITQLLEMLAIRHKVNIVASKDVTGKVSVNLFNVTLDEALGAILSVNGFSFIRRGKIIYVQKKLEVEGLALETRVFTMKWESSTAMTEVLNGLKTRAGQVIDAPSQGTVIVTDVVTALDDLAKVVERLDQRPKQVMIDAKLVEVGDSALHKAGLNWSSMESLQVLDLTAELSYNRQRTHVESSTAGRTKVLSRTIGSLIDVKAGILSDNEFNLILDFFDTLSDTSVVSAPRVMTLDNQEASIIVGTIVPIPIFDFATDTGTRTLSGFEEEQVGVELTVTPHCHAGGAITLEINPKVEEITDYISVGGDRQRPIKSTRQAQTRVLVNSDETVVIGGLIAKKQTITTTGLPILRELPWIGGLFRNKTDNTQKSELVIFVTPRLVAASPELSEREKALLARVPEH